MYFVEPEFVDNSGEKWFGRMSLKLLSMLDQLREETGYSIQIKKTTGAIGRRQGSSQHNVNRNNWDEVRAIDISVFNGDGTLLSGNQAEEFAKKAKNIGFTGIGVYPLWSTPGFHLDVRWNRNAGDPATWSDVGVYPEHSYKAINEGIELWKNR